MQLMMVGFLILVSIILIAYSLWPKSGVDDDVVRRRMRGQRGVDEVAEVQKKAKESAAQKMFERVAPLAVRPVMPKDEAEVSMLRIKLSNAGFRRDNAPTLFLASKTVLGIGLAAVAFLMMLSGGKPFKEILGWVTLMGGMGFMMPNLWLKLATSQRGGKIRSGMADAMDLMVISVEAGLALDAAIQRVGDELRNVHPELSEEFQIVTYEGQMGVPRSEALSNMGMRTGLSEVKSLVAVITQAEKFGTSVAKALRNQAETLRIKKRQAAEEAAQKTTVKLMLPLILFIFPAIFVVLLGPAVIQMIDTFSNSGLQ